jgi:hypothetical protein
MAVPDCAVPLPQPNTPARAGLDLILLPQGGEGAQRADEGADPPLRPPHCRWNTPSQRRGPLCPLHWVANRKSPPQWAAKPLRPKIQCPPIRASRRKDPEPASRERGPLCPPAAQSSAKTRTHGQRTRWGRKRPKTLHTHIAPREAETSAAGGRTSVSAPLGSQPTTPAPMGSQTAQSENAMPAHPRIPTKESKTSLAGARTSVSAHCSFIRKAPHPWAEDALGPQTPLQDMAVL